MAGRPGPLLKEQEVYVGGLSPEAAAQLSGSSGGGATAANQATGNASLAAIESATKAEDTVHASGDKGIMALAVRKDTPAGLAADGDYHAMLLDALGRLWAHIGVIEPGENLIGKVAGTAIVLSPTVTVDATPDYSIGDALSAKIELAGAVRVSGGSSLLHEIHILDRSNQKPTGSILIFNADPTAATITKNAAFVYSTDDSKQATRVQVASGDYVTINSKATADLPQLGRMIKAASGTSFWYVFVLDAALNLAATDDIKIDFKFIPVD